MRRPKIMPKQQQSPVKRGLQVKGEATGYVGYFFRKDEQDPSVDSLRAMREEAGNPAINKISVGSGVSAGALKNWWDGKTRKPQFATISAAAAFFGYEVVFRQRSMSISPKKLIHARAPAILKKEDR